jgi:pteridine reductase
MSDNKVVFITGAAQRLGANTARYLHRAGYNIVIHYNRSKVDADRLVEQLNKQRDNSSYALQGDLLSCDLQDLAQQAVSHWGRLDALINNASSFYATPLEEVTITSWNDLIGSNLKAPLFLSQSCAPYIQQNNGNIINMIDIHYSTAMPQHVIYSAAKSGLAGLTRSLALELAPLVRVNGIAPGAILWPENSSPEYQESILNKIPLQHIGSADDIAQAIQFLLEAPYVTGQIINIDGGRSLNI